MRPENPFHIYPVYTVDNDLSKLGYYSVPTYRTMSFQFLRSGSATVSAFDLVTDSGTVISQDVSEITSYAIAGGSTFYWSQGNSLSSPPSHGTRYRPRVRLSNGAIYWGHMCQANAIFDIAYPMLALGACTTLEVGLTPTYAVGSNVQIKIEDVHSSYEAVLDMSDPKIVLADLTASGNYAATITITAYLFNGNGGSRRLSVSYDFTCDPIDVCGTATLGSGTQSALEEINVFELTVFNSTDIQSKALLYSQGFRQKFWFVGEFLQPEPRVTESYKQNGQQDVTLQSARVSDALRLEFWPCPDRAALGLVNAKYNDNVILTGAGTSSTLYQMDFEPVPVENEDRPKGIITAEFDGAFIQSIMSDYAAG